MLLPPIPESFLAVPQRSKDWPLPSSPSDPAYRVLLDAIDASDPEEGGHLFREACVNDFYFFVRHCLSVGKYVCDDPYLPEWHGRPWFDHPWLFARCREIQAEPDGKLDLWPRFHFKTTLITQALTLWDFLVNPDLKVGFGTHKIDLTGEAMVSQVRTECENNELMKWHFPATFWADPERESSEWTSTCLRFKQSGNSREPSIIIFSVVGALPTSFHLDTIVLDDMVTQKSVTSADTIEATTDGWRRTAGIGSSHTRRRIVGTHWANNDTYKYILDLGGAELRYHDVYEEGTEKPVLRSSVWLHGDGTAQNIGQKLQMGPRDFAAQMRNKPSLGTVHAFEANWLRYYEKSPAELAPRLRKYLLIDTSASKTNDSDYNALAVIGLMRGIPLPNVYLLDLVHDRMNLSTLTDSIFELAEKWKVSWAFMEQIGAQRDIEHIKLAMPERGFSFRLLEYSSRVVKESRIQRLQIPFEQGRIYLPRQLFGSRDGRRVDLIYSFVQEQYLVWTPSGGSPFDDVLDVLSMIEAPELKRYLRAPESAQDTENDRYAKPDHVNGRFGNRTAREGLAQRAWAF